MPPGRTATTYENYASDSMHDSGDRCDRCAMQTRAPSDSLTQEHSLCQFLTADVGATDTLTRDRRH